MKNTIEAALRYLPEHIRIPLKRSLPLYENTVQELTLRANRPLCIYRGSQHSFLTKNGVLTDTPSYQHTVISSADDLSDAIRRLCDYSAYTRQDEINSGFITAKYGIRVGLCGTAVMRDHEVGNIKNITTLNIRIPREIKGCAEKLLSMIHPLDGVLVCGAPCSGKTTLIRDMVRLISERYKVTVVDERNEISAAFGADFGYDIGLSDVYVGLDKERAILQAVRSLSPDIVVCDELGDESDYHALRFAIRCGVAFIATLHADGIDDLMGRSVTEKLIKDGAFRYVVLLDSRNNAGSIKKIYDLR